MAAPNIKSTENLEGGRQLSEHTKAKRALFRILAWNPVSVKVNKGTTEQNEAEDDINKTKKELIKQIRDDAQNRRIEAADQGEVEVNALETAKERKARNRATDAELEKIASQELNEITGVVKASEDQKNKYTRCAPLSSYIITLQVKVVPFKIYEAALIEQTQKSLKSKSLLRKAARSIIGNSVFIKEVENKVTKSLLSDSPKRYTTYPITYNGTEVYDFYVDPEKVAVEAYPDVPPENANAKLVAYGKNFKNAILTTQNRAAENTGLTKDSKGLSDAQIVQRSINKYKKKIQESEPMRKVRDFLNKKTKIMSAGNTAIEVSDKTRGDDSDGNNQKKRKPGSQYLETKVGLGALKFNKFYQNLSKKIWYNPQPFSFEFKGWKPNILGKWFSSDNVKGVQTWKRNLGQLGDKAIAVAGMAAMIKGFEIAIEESGFGAQLEEAAKRAREFNQERGLPQTGTRSTRFDANNLIEDGKTIFDKSAPQPEKGNIEEFVRKI